MSPGDMEALEALNLRIDHVAATACLLSDHGNLDPEMSTAIRGIGETLKELAERIDDLARV